MSTTTDKLALFKYDPSTDGAQTFNIKKALNDNWDKLDDAVKEILITLSSKVSKSGDTMTGGLNINANYAALILRDADGSNNPIGEFEHYNGISKIGSTQNGRSRELHIRSDSVSPNIADAMALYDSGSASWYYILHTGNKPSGSYTGNGSEAARTINTGGIGGYCFIGDAYGFGFAIASGNGIACINIYNGNISYIRASDGSYFKDGILHVATSSELLNKSGYIFDYQVL